MSTVDAASAPGELRPRTDTGPLVLDPEVPLRVFRPTPGLALSVVSLAWLRAAGDDVRARLASWHLGPDEASYVATLALRRRREEWLAGRMALKYAVRAQQEHSGRTPTACRDIRIEQVAQGLRAGKPVTDLPVEVGLTHSGDYAVAVCGTGAVGVDLERPRTVSPPLARILAEDGESAGADPAGQRLRVMPLLLRWACKEAVLKYYGFGLRVDTREVRLTGWHEDGRFAWRPGPELMRHAPAAGGGLRTRACELDAYHLALVWSDPAST
jgi:4'-phosphopantetheinyl transferase